jgi:hypothetical protein
MKRKLKKSTLAILMAGMFITSCDKDTEEDNQEEVITTMKLTFVPVGGGTTVSYQYDDPDGPGGTAPTQQEIVLVPSKTYNVKVELFNKTVTPAEDITMEIKEEADAHRFYYETNPGSSITISGLDNDPNGVPLGINSTWTTAAAANGSVKITLRHYPAVPPNKAVADLVTSTKSGTDVEVIFVTKVQ